jgi:hypothetical protein
MGCDAGASSDHRADVFRSTASTLLCAYRRCGSSTRQDVVKVPRDCRTSLARVTKKISGSYNGAAYYAECGCVFSLV